MGYIPLFPGKGGPTRSKGRTRKSESVSDLTRTPTTRLRPKTTPGTPVVGPETGRGVSQSGHGEFLGSVE